MTVEPSAPKLWIVRVIIPTLLIVGVGLLLTRRAPAPVADSDLDSAERLHRIGLAINDATSALGRPPANASELRPFLAEQGDADRLLISPADGCPFVVLWAVDVRGIDPEAVIAYEQVGSGGRRWVLT